MKNAFLGIDPGLKGGLALIDGEDIIVLPMPTIGGEIDIAGLRTFLVDHAPKIKHAVIEHVWALPKQGAPSGFKFGKLCGIIEALVVAAGIPYTLVTPQKWMKVMHHGVASKEDTKNRGILVCQRLFPAVNLIPERCRTPHDGMSDALQMAEYGRRTLG